jgi:hypothetical protein
VDCELGDTLEPVEVFAEEAVGGIQLKLGRDDSFADVEISVAVTVDT